MKLLDAGTNYAKVLDGDRLEVWRSDKIPEGFHADVATGHNAQRFAEKVVNELVALARGGQAMIGERDFVLLDVGARDMKSIHVVNGRLASCNWNDSCGAMCGFSVELLGRHFDLDWTAIDPADEGLRVTCGVFAFSDLFDLIASGMAVPQAAAKFVKGLADMACAFAGSPETLHLSGGLCENPLYLESFTSNVIPLGRSVLLEGLRQSA